MSKKYRFIPLLALLSASLLLAGCDGDPENDDDIIDLDDIVDIEEFDTSNYTKLTTSTDLSGLWVAAGTGTFARDDGGDAKYGDQVALIYFMIKASGDDYEYANCFDTGTLEQSYNRGGYEPLTVGGGTLVFDSNRDGTDGDEELLSAEDDYNNTGTLTAFNEINSVFTFNDGDSIETNTFKMIKVSELTSTTFGTSLFENVSTGAKTTDELTCFAQWVGSYDTTEGLYQVERYDASFDNLTTPFTTSDYDSDDEDTEKQYSSISYDSVSATAQEDDAGDGINAHFFESKNALQFFFESSSIEHEGDLTITHEDLID